MTTVVLVRHGRSTANANGLLAGRADGVELDDVGRAQATALGGLISGVDVAAAYTSPMLRCRQTAGLLGHEAVVVDDLNECHYGEWTNRPLADLVTQALWEHIRATPSEVTFPGGESMLAMRDRTVDAVAGIVEAHEPGDVVLVVSHGDPIKAVLSDALGQSFDHFQRLEVGPASVSIVTYRDDAPPFVVCVNANSDVAALLARPTTPAPAPGGGDLARARDEPGESS